MTARVGYVLSALLLGVGALVGVQYSSATFTDDSNTPAQVTAARDWTPPSVSVDDPGFVVTGTVTITATASDADTSIASVEIQYRLQGSTDWLRICLDEDGSPWACSWNTTAAVDGDYELRAIATDEDGNTETSETVATKLANTAGVVIDPVDTPTRGVVQLTARAIGPGSGSATITFQYGLTLQGPWQPLPGCANLAGPEASCSFNTAPNSGTYHMRAEATFSSATYAAVQPDIVVDNAAPLVTQVVPGTPTFPGYTWVSGSIDITATASDVNTSVDSVLFEYRATGAGSWTTCGDDVSFPYACTLDTDSLPEGSYDFQTVGTDAVGNIATTTIVTRYVDRSDPTGSLTLPGTTYVPRAVLMSAVASDGGTGVRSVALRYKTNAAVTWSTACTDPTAPYSCTTPNLNNGVLYNFQAVITDNRGSTYATSVQNRTVDDSAPTVSQTIPAAPLSGSVSLSASADDAESGIASVEMQYKASAATSWSTICLSTSPPYGCAFDTVPLQNGTYNFRTIATNNAGASATTGTLNRTVTNTGTVTVTAPAASANIMGTTVITATASAPSGVTDVQLQYKTVAAATWTTLCTDPDASYSCDWDTSGLPYGAYQVRAVLKAGNGDTVTSAVVSVTVERFRGSAVDAARGGTLGQPSAGDTITLDFTSTADLGSILSGWGGAPTTVGLTFVAHDVGSSPDGRDYIAFPAGTNLGTISLQRNFVDNGGTVNFANATITAQTFTASPRNYTRITISLGDATSGATALNTSTQGNALRWYPSASVTDLTGAAAMTDVVTETGNDSDF